MSDCALRLLMYAAQQWDRLCTIADILPGLSEKPRTGKRSTTVRLRVA